MEKQPAHLAFKTHPQMEQKLSVDNEHVIVDKDMYDLVINYLRCHTITVEMLLSMQAARNNFAHMHSGLIDQMTLIKLEQNFKNLYLGKPLPHDDNACKALQEYEKDCEPYDSVIEYNRRVPFNHRIKSGALPNMQRYADKYNTTIQAMKEHWHCVERL